MGGINADFHILNQGGAPAIYENEYGLIPSAGYVGRLFVATDTKLLYRDNGASWDLIGGGGGSVTTDNISILGNGTGANPLYSGLDNILAKGQALTANRTFKFNSKNVQFTDNKVTEFTSYLNAEFLFKLDADNKKISVKSDLNNTLFTVESNKITGVYSTYPLFLFDVNNSLSYISNLNGAITNYFKIDHDIFKITHDITDNYFLIDIAAGSYKFGNYVNGGTYNDLAIIFINDFIGSGGSDQIVTQYNNSLDFGISLDFVNSNFKLGSYSGTNDCYINSDANANLLKFYVNNPLELSDNGTGNMISNTASGASGDHLVIVVNGTQYKIALLNP